MEQLRPADQRKRTDLRRMKVVATGFLVAATVIFIGTHAFEGAWVGYVRAAAEAGMVGALADWFAVTALFRYPLGIKIPHTAIIPARKNLFGQTLGDFVGINFLSEEVVTGKLRRAGIAERAGAWLKEPVNAERITHELASVVKGAVTVLRDEDVQAVLEHAIVERAVARPWGPPLGKLLNQVLTDGGHHKLVDLMCDRAYDWTRDNYTKIMGLVTDRSPTWSPKFVDAMLADKVYAELVDFAWAVKTDAGHPMREAVDHFLVEFSNDLQTDPATMQKAELVKDQMINHPDVRKVIGAAWGTAKKMLLDAAEDPSSELRTRIRDGLVTFGTRLVEDDDLRAKVDGWLEDAAGYVVNNYRAEITTLITDTVERWDAEETSRKIELQVGRDLQFIRINGTVVGALAGVVIYTVANLVF